MPTEEDMLSQFEITVKGDMPGDVYDDVSRFKKFIDGTFSVLTETPEKYTQL